MSSQRQADRSRTRSRWESRQQTVGGVLTLTAFATWARAVGQASLQLRSVTERRYSWLRCNGTLGRRSMNRFPFGQCRILRWSRRRSEERRVGKEVGGGGG